MDKTRNHRWPKRITRNPHPYTDYIIVSLTQPGPIWDATVVGGLRTPRVTPFIATDTKASIVKQKRTYHGQK